MHFLQVAKVDSDVAKHFCTELTAHEFLQTVLAMMELHVCAEAARAHVGLATNATTVRPSVGVCVHVVSKVLFVLEVVVTDLTSVPRFLDARESISEHGAGLGGRAVILLMAEASGREGTI